MLDVMKKFASRTAECKSTQKYTTNNIYFKISREKNQ